MFNLKNHNQKNKSFNNKVEIAIRCQIEQIAFDQLPRELIFLVISILSLQDMFAFSLINTKYFQLVMDMLIIDPYTYEVYPVLLISINNPIDDFYLKHLKEISEQNQNTPILINNSNKIKLYGLLETKWKLRELDPIDYDIESLDFPQPIDNQLNLAVYEATCGSPLGAILRRHAYLIKFSDILENNHKRQAKIERKIEIFSNYKNRTAFWKDIDRFHLHETIYRANQDLNAICLNYLPNPFRKYYFNFIKRACYIMPRMCVFIELKTIMSLLENAITLTCPTQPYKLLGRMVVCAAFLYCQRKIAQLYREREEAEDLTSELNDLPNPFL